MADYSAKIKLIVDGLQSLKQVEERVKNLNRLAAVDLGKALTGVKGFGSVKKEVDGVADSFSRLGKIVRGLAVGTGLGALTTSINGLSQAATALKFGGISKFAAALAAATGPAAGLFKELSNLAIQFPVVAGTATIAGAALLAFAPQVLRAGNATVRLGKAAAEAGQPLSRLMASLAGSGFRVDMFIDAAEATEIYRNRLYELSETVFVLSRRQASLKGTLDKFNSDSETAAKIAAKLVDVTKRLNAEQQAQNDLLREAAGLRPESVERRATNTYNVTQRRKAFELEQASDIEALNESLRRLESRRINWADALGIDAIEGAARNADRLSQAWAKNQQALTSWENALREGGQWLKELQASMRTDAADAYTRALLNQQRVLDTYADSAAQARRAVEGLGYRGETPALRPAGFTDQDVRIKNMLDDQETAARTIFSIESEFNKKVHFTELDFIQKELEAEIDKIEAIGAAQKKADTAALKDFDARLKIRTEKSARRRQMTENVIIGGAFPMLFGGGPGAVLGGAAGGFIPGNPMLSVATSAVGAAIDSFITKTTELGGALLSVSSTFDTLKERALISNREREKEIQLLQDAGFAATANAVAQEELFKTIGANGVESLRQLGTESDRLNRTWAELSVQIQAVVAGPLADLAAKFNEFFKPIAQAGRAEALRADLSAADRARFNQELNRAAAKGTYRPTGEMNRPQLEALATVRPEQLQALLDKYGKLRVNADVKFDPKQVREQTVNILQKQLEVIDIAAKFKEAGEKQRELDKQRYDLIEGYEDSIAAIRRRIEDEISNKRLSVLQKENQLLDVQAQIRQESLALANAQALSTAGQGLPTAAQFGGNNPFRTRAFKDVAQQAAEAAGSFLEQELSLAEQAAKLKRDAALDALRTDIEAAKFQADTAREVNKLNIDTAKRVAEINASIRKQNASQDNRRFEIEQKLAIIRLQTLQAEFSLLATRAPTDNLREEAQILTQFSIAATKYVEAQKAPAPLKELGGIGAQGVSFAGLDAINAQLKLTQDRINAAQLALNDLLVLKNEQEFVAKMQRIAEGIDAPLQTLTEELVANEATRTRYAELIREGVRGVVAERLIEVEQLKEAAVLQYDAVILELEKKLQIDSTNEKLKEQIILYKERRDAVAGKAATAVDAIKEEESPAARLQAAITKAREELTELADPINAAITGANAIGSAFSQAFQGIATGTMTAQEALSNFFKSIGEAFVSMAAEIIAKQLVMITLQTILKALGVATSAGGGGGGGSGGGISDIGNWQQYAFEGPGVPFTPPATFATGGFVTGPTRALIGEGGEPEYVIPQSKMSAAMSRYSRGARGESVIPGNGTSTEGGGAATATMEPIDVRYSVERINNVDYVTADQFQRGMAQAAQQGAVQGERRALRTLQNSAATRRRTGI